MYCICLCEGVAVLSSERKMLQDEIPSPDRSSAAFNINTELQSVGTAAKHTLIYISFELQKSLICWHDETHFHLLAVTSNAYKYMELE